MLTEMLAMTRRLEGSSGAAAAGSAGRRRRPLAVGRSSPEGSWLWVSPEAEEAREAIPGPWSLTLLLRGRPAGGSSP